MVTVDGFLKNVHRWSVLIQGKVALSLASRAGDWHSWARSWGHPWAWLEIHACERKARHFSHSWKVRWVCQSIAWSSRHLSLKRRDDNGWSLLDYGEIFSCSVLGWAEDAHLPQRVSQKNRVGPFSIHSAVWNLSSYQPKVSITLSIKHTLSQ